VGALTVRADAAAEPSDGSPAASTAPGQPDEAACLAAYTDSQRLRKAGKLNEAYQRLLICSQRSCPSVVKADCVPWLAETERARPSIVVVAKGVDGEDTAEVRLLIDGRLAAARLDGRPIALDPGPRRLRFEHAGLPPIEKTIVVQVGIKNRRVDVSFAADTPTPQPGPARPAPDPPPPERGEPIVGYVLTGVGALALGSFAVFGLIGSAEADEYDETCAPTKSCDPDDVSATETKLLVADISLVVGIAAVGVGVGLILYDKLSDPDPDVATLRLALRPTAGGATGQLSLSF
ncbi:MAG: hypothetical protein JRI23_25000, partial [Deltaproteobacteria bacterium]|nr:hypothetical protein [Deltaproteobacteria bacterium]MBW2535275.1 hypothetical protein [Deltaproteobacteria bacterium]